MNIKYLMDRQHEHRADLAGEHRLGDIGQIVGLVVFLAVWISDTFVLHYSDAFGRYIPQLVSIPVAVAFLLSTSYLSGTGLRIVFGEVRDTPAVIRKGVFGRGRHPIYLGAILTYAAWLLLRFSLAATLLWFGILVLYQFLACHEERLLLKKFGHEYAEYMQEVPMWIPRVL
jgi:protein-S-isoprenylcysteine O-methyltransferase Ste14